MRKHIKAALQEGRKSRCDRAHVGCVIVDNDTDEIVSRGFNETPKPLEPCDTSGHKLIDGHCVNTIHAERNAVNNMQSWDGEYTLYVTHYPCVGCASLIAQHTEIVKIVYLCDYKVDNDAVRLLSNLKKGVHRFEK